MEKLNHKQIYSKPRLLGLTYEYFIGHDTTIKSSKNDLFYEELIKETKRIILAKKRCH